MPCHRFPSPFTFSFFFFLIYFSFYLLGMIAPYINIYQGHNLLDLTSVIECNSAIHLGVGERERERKRKRKRGVDQLSSLPLQSY